MKGYQELYQAGFALDRRMDETASLVNYWVAPSGLGPFAAMWDDKPHRLLYDLIGEVAKLQEELDSLKEVTK